MIHIIASQYNPTHEALEIYLSGCKQNCPGCHNPETHAFGQGQRWERWIKDNAYKLKHPDGMFRRIWIMGGEPLDQNTVDLKELIHSLHRANPALERWLWTAYELTDLTGSLRNALSFVKTGRYMWNQEGYDVVYEAGCPPLHLASPNQQLFTKETACPPSDATPSPISKFPDSPAKLWRPLTGSSLNAAQVF